MLKIIAANKVEGLLARSGEDLERAERAVEPILRAVRREGDRGLARWAQKLDGAPPRALDRAAMAAAWGRLPPPLRRALRHAAANIERMARWQMPRPFTRQIEPGARVGQIIRPLASVGCYVPGGRHPLPSTLLMTAIPARVAGVARIVAVSPQPADEVLGAAHLAGVREFHTVGGAQAIAALAYGTAMIPRVDKIVGPGNIFVAAAKRRVRSDCEIDFLAGPTEVLVIAEADANPDWVAADLLAQAEHDPLAAAWLATPSRRLAAAVNRALAAQLAAAPNPVAAQSLAARGAIILTRSLEEALAAANRIAPEHLTVPRRLLPAVTAAGSIFVGAYAPQAAGDYLAGPNHTLPTATLARCRGGLSALDFVKIITVQELTRAGLRRAAPSILALAAAEGLPAHAASVQIRLMPSPAPTRRPRPAR